MEDYETPSVRACVLYVSLIYEDVFTKSAKMFMAKSMFVNNFLPILKNNMTAIADCYKIINDSIF